MKKLHLFLGLTTVALLIVAALRMAQPPFGFNDVCEIARVRSSQTFQPRQDDLPANLKNLNYDQTRDIRWREESTLWQDAELPFQVKFFHRTGWQPDRVDIFEIKDKKPRRLIYAAKQFNFGKNNLPMQPMNDLGFAGFRVHYPINRKDYLDETIVFLGGSYFRAVARNQQYGLSARAVTVNCAVRGQVEEFPRFTRFWLQRPERSSTRLRILALLEGPSLTGAYEFVVSPGEETRVEVKSKLFIRKKIERLGIAALTSMYWFGENYRLDVQDVRPEVHDSDGLLVHNTTGEWLWHPLSNAKHLRENFFEDKAGSSFGLMQRDVDFANYEDLESHYEKRPSAWVEPIGETSGGKVTLIQLPTNKETDDNIVAFWWNGKPAEAGSIVDSSYTLYWHGPHPSRPPLALSNQTRIHYPVGKEPARFSIDFNGGTLGKIPPDRPPDIDLSTQPPGLARDVQIAYNEHIQGWRITFILPGNSASPRSVELRCRLMSKEQPLTETWTYTWEPRA